MTSTLVEIPADPTPAQLSRARARVRAAGIDPADSMNLAALAAHISSDNSPAIVRAVGILASQIMCPMACGRKLDVANKDALGLMLCPECMEEAEMENAHSDGHHVDEPDLSCPACVETVVTAITAGPPALTAGERRRPGRPAGEKHDDCPACGFHFTTPQSVCRDKAACARRAAARKSA